MTQLGAPVDKMATMPVYIVAVRFSDETDVTYFKARKDTVDFYQNHVELRGCTITKANANKLKKVKDKKEIDRALGTKDKQVHLFIPWPQIVRVEHITFGGIA